MAVKRLLCIVGGMNAGGAETFLMKLYRQIDKTKYQMDFAVGKEGKGHYDDEILSMGGRIFHIVPKSHGLIKNFNDVKNLVKRENYNYVLRTSQNSLSALELLAAKLGGAKVYAYRSSNSDSIAVSLKSHIFHKVFSVMPKIFANVRIAPSTEAAEFMFGKNCVKNGKAHLLHNGLDFDEYKFNPETRKNLRTELGVNDCLVIGHVGRFSYQKNHTFLIDIYKNICQQNKNVKFVLVGIGELEDEIKKKVHSLGLDDKVLFLGKRCDVSKLMSAFDILVFPSLYEGMPNVIIEAQACGLPCIISDTITPEADITGLVKYMSLEASAEQWAEAVLKEAEYDNRIDTYSAFKEEKYDIQSVTDSFIHLIFEGVTK